MRLKFVLLLVVLSIMTGCAKKDVHSVFQTNGASLVNDHTYALQNFLLKYYELLNKRNPKYTKKIDRIPIIYDIQNHTNNATLPKLDHIKDANYKDYLNIAFRKNYVDNRNDYLIAGIYKMLYWAYDKDRVHTVTTMQYDPKKLKVANEMMQVIQYRVENEKDVDGNYLFTTWQREWQVELLKSVYGGEKIDLNKYSNETLLSPSNMYFRVYSEGMIFTIQESLRYLGEEGKNLGTSALSSVFIFL